VSSESPAFSFVFGHDITTVELHPHYMSGYGPHNEVIDADRVVTFVDLVLATSGIHKQ
jgi:hypothetical protein